MLHLQLPLLLQLLLMLPLLLLQPQLLSPPLLKEMLRLLLQNLHVPLERSNIMLQKMRMIT